MSRLDELIREFCPDGVPFKPLGEVVKFLNGRAYGQSELLDSGKYKVLRVGNFHTNDKWYYSDLELDEDKYCNDGDLLYTWAATLGPQIWNGEKVIYHYHIWKLVFNENVLCKQFLYHFLLMDIDTISKSLTNSTMPHISMASMNKRTIVSNCDVGIPMKRKSWARKIFMKGREHNERYSSNLLQYCK